jgi:hypothetical protein
MGAARILVHGREPELCLLTSKTFKDTVTDFIQENVKHFRTEDREGYFKYLW